MKLVIASNNKNKIYEIKTILAPFFQDIVSASSVGYHESVEENGTTFYENALAKAKAVCKALNCVALADDSGLCVDALNGVPGVYSARYSGEQGNDYQNNIKLLNAMQGKTDRSCRFACCVVLCYPDGKVISCEGECRGELLNDFQGSNGFGYDSLFYSYELKKSFGIASESEKNEISHRAKALKDLVNKL